MNPLARLREKNLHWVPAWLRERARPRPRVEGPRHLLFCFVDHWEPVWGQASREVGDRRVRRWLERWPALAGEFRDSRGRTPRHGFFFPGEQYVPAWMDGLADLARRGLGEVELHLHHDGDTPETLRRALERHVAAMAEHGHFTRVDGRPRWAFIHGNWALANARADGRRCGVDAELPLLFEAGCYADFTFPAAPDECQPRLVNQLYWPDGDLSARRAYERGRGARVGERFDDRLLMVTGPIALARKRGRVPLRIEAGDVTKNDPPTPDRVRTWVDQGIHVEGRPEWVFVKIHTHGAPDAQAESLLGEPGRALHRELAARYADGRRWLLHYVSPRELVNVALAAMDGRTGDPHDYLDYRLPKPPCAA